LKITSTILILFLSFHANSQLSWQDAVKVLNKESLISNVLNNKKFQKNKILTDRFAADSIDFNVVVYSDVFKSEIRKRGFLIEEPSYYRIDVYTINDTIIFKKIASESSPKQTQTPISPKLFSVDTLRIKNYVDNHNRKYFSSWTVDDFLNHQFESRTFGSMCGGAGGDLTEQARSLAKLIKANDTTLIRYLASSFSAEERAYGTAGLYALLARGVNLSDELLNLIVTNQESKNWVSYCGGCIHGTGRMYNVLQTKKLSEFYHTLKNFRAL
jgi:hypothetical protein